MSDAHIGLGAGGGGRTQRELIAWIKARLDNRWLAPLEDAALLGTMAGAGESVVFTTDSYVVNPLVFPGGDIGSLAVCGTVNDLAVMGARPQYLSLALIIEEGLARATLELALDSIARRATEAGVAVVTGDTKVVEHGRGHGLYITTAGVGVRPAGRDLGAHRLAPGQAVLVSGALGDHAIAVLLSREGLDFESDAVSDCAPLNGLIEQVLAAVGPAAVHAIRDLTRGGLAAALNEFAESASVDLHIREPELPVNPAVRAAARVLGFEPTVLANEGKLVLFVDAAVADTALAALTSHPYGRQAAMVGEVGARFDPAQPPAGRPRRPLVLLETATGGKRVLDLPLGELLPRIC